MHDRLVLRVSRGVFVHLLHTINTGSVSNTSDANTAGTACKHLGNLDESSDQSLLSSIQV